MHTNNQILDAEIAVLEALEPVELFAQDVGGYGYCDNYSGSVQCEGGLTYTQST